MSAPVQVALAGAAREAAERHLPALVDGKVASAIGRQDPTLWGPDAEGEAAVRLSWVDLPTSSRPLVEQVARLRERLRAAGARRVVLAGMGGSSLAPEVVCAAAGVPLTVLDTTDPQQVRGVLAEGVDDVALVVSSKSGTTVETDSHRRVFEQAFRDAGVDPADRIVVVTDPASPLESSAAEAGYAVVAADPHVGGRYSALTAFGLVPAGLAGADVGALLDEAAAAVDVLRGDDPDNPALRLGAALGGTDPLRDKVALVVDGDGLRGPQSLQGLPDWAEQLIAESTGKDGTGLLPVVVGSPDAPEVQAPAADVLVARLSSSGGGDDGVGGGGDEGGDRPSVVVSGPLGAQLLLWETATAVAGRLLGINPFDQPDVEAAKKAARGLLDSGPDPGPPALVDGPVEVRGSADLLGDARDLENAVAALLAALADVGDRGYLAVMAYLDRRADAALAQVRDPLARRTGRPVTFGWGPRFLHSTGQYHKGGPPTGVYLSVTADPGEDLAIPGQPFTFGRLVAAQAAGDAQVLAGKGRPVLRLHLTDRAAGVARLREVLR